MKKIMFIMVILCGCIFSGCDLKENYKRTVEMPLQIAPGQQLIVTTDVGSISISKTDDPQYSIKAEITGKGNTNEKAQRVAESVNIKIENKTENIVVIKIDKPFEIKSDWLTVDFYIEAPADINLDCKTDVGSINISDIMGDISAKCDVGSIKCSGVCGRLDLKTDVGEINAKFANDIDIVNADLTTDVGSIHFKAPENMSAMVYASTDVGSIHSSLRAADQKIEGDCCSKKFTATTGKGEGKVSLKTDVGSITINK